MSTEENRRALVTYVINFVGNERPIGKKAAQKFVHIIDDAGSVPTGFNFSIYTYGPFSRSLDSELDILDGLKAISVRYDASNSAFNIQPSERATETIAKGSVFIEKYRKRIDLILATLKGKTGRELELYSTLIYLMSHVDSLKDDKSVVNKLLELKPKYQRTEVETTLASSKMLMSN